MVPSAKKQCNLQIKRRYLHIAAITVEVKTLLKIAEPYSSATHDLITGVWHPGHLRMSAAVIAEDGISLATLYLGYARTHLRQLDEVRVELSPFSLPRMKAEHVRARVRLIRKAT